MVDVSNLKKACSDAQDCIQNLDAEVSEALDMVVILTHGTDGGLACILQSISSKLKKITDDYVMDCINNLMDLESGLQMYKEEHSELGTLPGLTDVEVYDEENDEVVNIESSTKKRGRKKKTDKTLDDIFNDQELLEIGNEAFGK